MTRLNTLALINSLRGNGTSVLNYTLQIQLKINNIEFLLIYRKINKSHILRYAL